MWKPSWRCLTARPGPSAIGSLDTFMWQRLQVSPLRPAWVKIVPLHSANERSMWTFSVGVMMSWHEPHIVDLFVSDAMRFVSFSVLWAGVSDGFDVPPCIV